MSLPFEQHLASPMSSIRYDCPRLPSGGIWTEVLSKLCNDAPSTSSMASVGEGLVKIEVLDDEEQFCQGAAGRRIGRLPSPPEYENASDAECVYDRSFW